METNDRQFVDQVEAARILCLKNPKTLNAWRQDGVGPPYFKMGRRLIRYDINELHAWARSGKA